MNGATPDGAVRVSSKSKDILVLLSAFLGVLGIDRFYRGQWVLGLVKLLTAGGCGIWALIDHVMYLVGDLPTDESGAVIVDTKTLQLMQSGVRLVDQFGSPLRP